MTTLTEYADYLWHADDLEQADLEETCRRLKAADSLIGFVQMVLNEPETDDSHAAKYLRIKAAFARHDTRSTT